jgi:hypothetical protein
LSNQAEVFEVIQNNPGIGAAGLAAALNMHKPNARRDALKLVDRGLIEARETDQGYAFFPVSGSVNVQTHFQKNAVDNYRPPAVLDLTPVQRSNGPVIQTDISDSRLHPRPAAGTGIVVHRTPVPSANRRDLALSAAMGAISRAFQNDPDGDEAMVWIASAINANAAAVQDAERHARIEHERQIAADKQAVEKARAEAAELARKDDWNWAREPVATPAAFPVAASVDPPNCVIVFLVLYPLQLPNRMNPSPATSTPPKSQLISTCGTTPAPVNSTSARAMIMARA